MITIICVGKIKEDYIRDMISDYYNRISKYHKISIIELKDSNINNEEKEIIKYLKKDAYKIALDLRGRKYDRLGFAKKISDTFIYNANIIFVIGGSDGIADAVKNLCDEKISFSDMTFPHGLFRAILLEQIYRSFKIINNEIYHK